MGWIMGPWECRRAARRRTLVLYEGAPDYPGPGRLWALVERHRLTVLGVSPTLIRALRATATSRSAARPARRAHLRLHRRAWNPEP